MNLVTRDVPGPTSKVRQALRGPEAILAQAECILDAFAACDIPSYLGCPDYPPAAIANGRGGY